MAPTMDITAKIISQAIIVTITGIMYIWDKISLRLILLEIHREHVTKLYIKKNDELFLISVIK